MIGVDASVAVKWVLRENYSPQAIALYADATRTGQLIVAPRLLMFEVTNIVRKRMVRESLALADADRLLTDFLTYPVSLRAPADLHRRALALAAAHTLPAAYDAHYLVVAQHYACDLWTDDQRLLRATAGALPFVKWIGAYPAPPSP